jgi:hypothetical protein
MQGSIMETIFFLEGKRNNYLGVTLMRKSGSSFHYIFLQEKKKDVIQTLALGD